jgi:PAS domain S-box-containing protein
MAASFQDFRSLVEQSPDAICLIDTQGDILYGSSSNTKLFGYPPDEIVGKNCLDMVHPEDREPSRKALHQATSKLPGSIQWNARMRGKDGHYLWVESTVSNLQLEADAPVIVVRQRDISERKAEEEKSQLQSEKLTLSNLRLEEFAYTVAHDLREPLRTISLYTQLLAKNFALDSDSAQMSNFVISSAARMTTLVDDLLSFARTGMPGPNQLVDANHALAAALQNLVLEIKQSAAVITVDPLPAVFTDESHLVRIFQNLVSNAVKYRSDRPLKVHVSAEPDGPLWVMKVRDNGVGIAAKNQSRVFLPFVRLVSRDIAGSGLGLAVCKKIVEGLGGSIWVESEVGVGSVFAFTIAANPTPSN